MQMIGAQVRQATQIRVLQDIERHQRGDALPVRRDFIHPHAAVIGADRFDPFRAIRGEIPEFQQSVLGMAETYNLLGDGTTIEGIAPAARDLAQRLASRG